MQSIEIIRTLPFQFIPTSAYADFLHLIACGKPAIRIHVEETDHRLIIEGWCSSYSLFTQIDFEGYITIAHDKAHAARVMELDQDKYAHEFELGLLLGYPECCCTFIAEVGEENIDLVEKKMSSWNFTEEFKYINPNGYLSGNSLICHLPCCPTCYPSLQIALNALKFIKENRTESVLEPWFRWLG